MEEQVSTIKQEHMNAIFDVYFDLYKKLLNERYAFENLSKYIKSSNDGLSEDVVDIIESKFKSRESDPEFIECLHEFVDRFSVLPPQPFELSAKSR